jgi:hypothetical protein
MMNYQTMQQAGKFSIVPLLLNIGSGIALLGIVSSCHSLL